MFQDIKKKFLILTIFQLLILTISLIFDHQVSLLSYINISFYITAALLLTSLLLYTIHSGFFDAISKSFNLVFSRGHEKRKLEDVPSLSELITFDQKPLLFHGLVNGTLMLAALFVYYFLLT